jgi:hypothetical protein
MLADLVKQAAHLVQPLAPNRAHIVLEGGGPVVRVHHMARLLVQVSHPLAELVGIGERGRQEHLHSTAQHSTAH